MVSGLITSPELQLRICLEEARLISMASKLFMSIIWLWLSIAGESVCDAAPAWPLAGACRWVARVAPAPWPPRSRRRGPGLLRLAGLALGVYLLKTLEIHAVVVCERLLGVAPRRRARRLGVAAVRRSGVGGVLALDRLVGGVAGERTHAGEVDAELLGRAQQVVVFIAHLRALALLGDHVDVERQRLHLLEQDFEGLRDGGLGDVLALDDRLVGLDTPDGVVGLDREHLLQRVGGAEGLERPHLHLAEALPAELG